MKVIKIKNTSTEKKSIKIYSKSKLRFFVSRLLYCMNSITVNWAEKAWSSD